MKVAVVILNWNGKELLRQFLPSVIRHSGDANLYIADNNSTDDSISYVQKNFPEARLIQLTENRGYAGGYNYALEHVEEEIAILLNNDIEVTADWLKPIISVFEKHPDAAAVQPKILDYKKKDYFEYAGAAGGYLDKYGYPFCRGRIFQHIEKDIGQYNDEKEIFWASGACLALKTKYFREIGGMDTDFFSHMEEIDLCWQFKNKGYQIWYTGHSEILHVGGATLDNQNARKTFLNFRNGLYLLLKNVPQSHIYGILFIRMILDGVAAFHFLFQGKINHFLSVGKAHAAFYSNFQKIKKKRTTNPKISNYFKTHSIVFQYFVRKKKDFKDL